ncbi:MAG: pyrroline-5-carboxylate reductase [Thermodesulfobacteriota bacterium]
MGLTQKIGFVGGGRMAEALVKGMLASGLTQAKYLAAADPSKERRETLAREYRIKTHATADKVWQECEIVILAVKPQVVKAVLAESRELVTVSHLIISIAAGVPLALLEGCLSHCRARVVRVMPNTPALVLAAASALSPGRYATEKDLACAKAIFDAVGTSVVLDECYLDAVTGLSGSGPAYVFSFLEALTDAGVKVGLARPVAETLALQTILGSVQLALETQGHPAELRAMVTSPGGTTIAGLHALERGAFRGLIMDAVEAATLRSRELAKGAAD